MANTTLRAPGQARPGPEPINMQLGMAYVRRQSWEQVYAPDTALCVGTIFPELEFPFMGKGGGSR